jgi:deoxyguanosine kinase
MSSFMLTYPKDIPEEQKQHILGAVQEIQKPDAGYRFVTIEGNIGSGKSTLINLIRQKYPEYLILDEPVSSWMDLKDNQKKNLLELFYEDKFRWSYTFQNAAFITRYVSALQAIQKCNSSFINKTTSMMSEIQNSNQPFNGIDMPKKTIILSERGIFTDRQVFAKMLFNDGWLNELEYKLYMSWFDVFSASIHLHGIVYVNTNADVCAERIVRRARSGEELIAQDYLDSLDQYHKDWMKEVTVPLLEIDSDEGNLEVIHNFLQDL